MIAHFVLMLLIATAATRPIPDRELTISRSQWAHAEFNHSEQRYFPIFDGEKLTPSGFMLGSCGVDYFVMTDVTDIRRLRDYDGSTNTAFFKLPEEFRNARGTIEAIDAANEDNSLTDHEREAVIFQLFKKVHIYVTFVD